MVYKQKLFDEMMIDIYRCAKSEVNYNPVRFFDILNRCGGLETAKKLINIRNVSDGYTRLYLEDRLDLTVEATIFDNIKWYSLFTIEELGVVKKRLKKYEYKPALGIKI